MVLDLYIITQNIFIKMSQTEKERFSLNHTYISYIYFFLVQIFLHLYLNTIIKHF